MQVHCPFRHGLYQMMRNRVTLDALQERDGLAWCDFVACLHPGNQDARRLPEPVSDRVEALAAFRTLVQPGALLEWDARVVLEAITESGSAPSGWPEWMRCKYLLGTYASEEGES